MLYVSKDHGQAIGEIVNAILDKYEVDGIELKMTQTEITVSMAHPSKTKCADGKKNGQNKVGNAKLYEYCGKEMTLREWAKVVGKSTSAIEYRFKKYGNPYGKRAENNDKNKIVIG